MSDVKVSEDAMFRAVELKTTEELKHVPFEMYARVLARAEQAEKRVGELEGEVGNRLAQAEAKIASGMSWGGFNLLGDGKSIDEAKRLLHEAGRAEQLVVLIKDERARAEQAEAQLAESEASCDRLRSAYDDVRALNAQLAVNHADIVTPLRAELAEAKSALSAEREDFESLATIHAENKARIASLEKSVTMLRDALMTNPITQPEVSFLRNARKAALAILDAAPSAMEEQLHYANGTCDLALKHRDIAEARIASLEKSVTMLRAENVELREIASGLSYYADGHGLQEKWAAELRALNQRLGALAAGEGR